MTAADQKSRLRRHSLTKAGYDTLKEIEVSPERLTDLSGVVGININNLSPLATRLEQMGLATRSKDGRCTWLTITRKGAATLEEIDRE